MNLNSSKWKTLVYLDSFVSVNDLVSHIYCEPVAYLKVLYMSLHLWAKQTYSLAFTVHMSYRSIQHLEPGENQNHELARRYVSRQLAS